jgi:hypothetical protein
MDIIRRLEQGAHTLARLSSLARMAEALVVELSLLLAGPVMFAALAAAVRITLPRRLGYADCSSRTSERRSPVAIALSTTTPAAWNAARIASEALARAANGSLLSTVTETVTRTASPSRTVPTEGSTVAVSRSSMTASMRSVISSSVRRRPGLSTADASTVYTNFTLRPCTRTSHYGREHSLTMRDTLLRVQGLLMSPAGASHDRESPLRRLPGPCGLAPASSLLRSQ